MLAFYPVSEFYTVLSLSKGHFCLGHCPCNLVTNQVLHPAMFERYRFDVAETLQKSISDLDIKEIPRSYNIIWAGLIDMATYHRQLLLKVKHLGQLYACFLVTL
ncbi:MAG: hypothetical protein CM1200mP15_03920 [Dehalococcoidia bacterium]|nr:MAG: hypothetical protein CM1200mP15_03920 [Dehalococcoidia bacterium]